MPIFVLEPILRPGLHFRHRLCQHNVRQTFFISRSDTEAWWFSVALYGLIIFYGLTKDELKGKRPLAKFLAIKLIVFFTFYQSFVVSPNPPVMKFLPQNFPKFTMLEGRVIHGLPCTNNPRPPLIFPQLHSIGRRPTSPTA